MTNAVVSQPVRSLSGLDGPVYFQWPNRIDSALQWDILALMNLVLAKETTLGFPAPLSDNEGQQHMQALANAVSSGNKRVLLLYETTTDKVVGHMLLTPHELPNCKHIAEISRLFIHPHYRGVKALRAGLREIISESDRLGIEVITLDVRANTRIHQLWQRLGFETIGCMPDYARVNGEKFFGCYMYQTVEQLKSCIQMKG